MKLINLIGKKFGSLTVLRQLGENAQGQPKWECICICGNTKLINGRDLREGSAISCGCYRLEQIKTRCIIHGKTNSTEYKSWSGMKQRCSPTSKKKKYYYDKGVSVCKRWENSFENFLKDMGKKPTPKHSIDRFPNNNGNYKPSNCRWATQQQQCDNLRTVKNIRYKGQEKTLKEWAIFLKVGRGSIYKRLKKDSMNNTLKHFERKITSALNAQTSLIHCQ